MSEKEKQIRELVKSYYIDNPTATEEMIEEAIEKAFSCKSSRTSIVNRKTKSYAKNTNGF